jgi:heme/copper-type cytochrome/quinol oxidase subunit 2
MVILAGLSAGVLGVFAAFLIEFVRRRKEQEAKEKNS